MEIKSVKWLKIHQWLVPDMNLYSGVWPLVLVVLIKILFLSKHAHNHAIIDHLISPWLISLEAIFSVCSFADLCRQTVVFPSWLLLLRLSIFTFCHGTCNIQWIQCQIYHWKFLVNETVEQFETMSLEFRQRKLKVGFSFLLLFRSCRLKWQLLLTDF